MYVRPSAENNRVIANATSCWGGLSATAIYNNNNGLYLCVCVCRCTGQMSGQSVFVGARGCVGWGDGINELSMRVRVRFSNSHSLCCLCYPNRSFISRRHMLQIGGSATLQPHQQTRTQSTNCNRSIIGSNLA